MTRLVFNNFRNKKKMLHKVHYTVYFNLYYTYLMLTTKNNIMSSLLQY